MLIWYKDANYCVLVVLRVLVYLRMLAYRHLIDGVPQGIKAVRSLSLIHHLRQLVHCFFGGRMNDRKNALHQCAFSTEDGFL